MSFGTGFVIVTCIICVTILFAFYIFFCAEEHKGVFENRGKKYDYKFDELCSDTKEILNRLNDFEKEKRE